jgi:hypothetical protein
MAGNTISMFRGDDKQFDLHFAYSGTGSPLNITGFSVYFTVKNSISDLDGSAIIQKIVTTHTSPINGSSNFILNNSDTSGLSEKTYFYDIQFKNTSGQRTTVTRGNFVITNDVTLS